MVARRIPWYLRKRFRKLRRRWFRRPRWRFARVVPRHKIKERVERLAKIKKEPRYFVRELILKNWEADTEINYELPKFGRLSAIDLLIYYKITTADAGSPSQPELWHLKAWGDIEISDSGKTYIRAPIRALKLYSALVFDTDIVDPRTSELSKVLEGIDIVRIEFDWNVRSDFVLEQFPFETGVGLNLMNKRDPVMTFKTKSVDMTDTTIDYLRIRPILYLQQTEKPVLPEPWVEYIKQSLDTITTYEVSPSEGVFHISDVIILEDTNGNLADIDKVEVKDAETDTTYLTLSDPWEVVRVWCEQDKQIKAFPVYLGYFRNPYIAKKREVVYRVLNKVEGNLILLQVGYKK